MSRNKIGVLLFSIILILNAGCVSDVNVSERGAKKNNKSNNSVKTKRRPSPKAEPIKRHKEYTKNRARKQAENSGLLALGNNLEDLIETEAESLERNKEYKKNRAHKQATKIKSLVLRNELAQEKLSGNRPRSHVWKYLLNYGEEDRHFATYSYVLAGRDNYDKKTFENYLSVIRAIQSSTQDIKTLNKALTGLLLEEKIKIYGKHNLFIIPAIQEDEEFKFQPNYPLSKTLISLLSTKSDLILNSSGPFIITLSEPLSFIGNYNKYIDILYVDLTGINEAAIKETVRTYKTHIVENRLSGIEKLHSFRLALLNIGLMVEANIGFAKVAYADLRKSFDVLFASGETGVSRSAEEIQVVFDRYKAALYRIYNRELRKNPSLRGKILLKVNIAPDGKVINCKIETTDIDSVGLQAKIVARIKRFNFGKKIGVSSTTILYPIEFLPAY